MKDIRLVPQSYASTSGSSAIVLRCQISRSCLIADNSGALATKEARSTRVVASKTTGRSHLATSGPPSPDFLAVPVVFMILEGCGHKFHNVGRYFKKPRQHVAVEAGVKSRKDSADYLPLMSSNCPSSRRIQIRGKNST
jgi:hypothetical protein